MSVVSWVPTEINQEAACVLLVYFCNLYGMLHMWRVSGVDGDLTFVPGEIVTEIGDGAESNSAAKDI